MKYTKFWLFYLFFLAVLLIAGCQAKENSGSDTLGEANFSKDASYALGYSSGMDWKENGVVPDFAEAFKGIKAAYGLEEPRISVDDMYMIFSEAFYALQVQKSEKNKQDEIDFLAQNSKKEGIVITGSGLQYEVLSEGRGAKPGPGDKVRVHYEGTLTDGTVFDSTYERGEPAEISLSGVFPGWTEGLQLMNEGSSYRFYIPSDLAYGSMNNGVIPPYSTLIFKIELINIVR